MTQEQTKSLATGVQLAKKEFSEKQLERLIAVFSPMPLVKYPYFVSLGRRKRKREVSFEETTRDGTSVKWTAKSPDYLPGEMEFKVWCWILHKVSDASKPLPPEFHIPYTIPEIASYWNMAHGGRPQFLIYKAIQNLQDTSIHHWLQSPDKQPEDLSYSLLAGRVGQGDNKDEQILTKNVIFLDPILIRLLNKGPIKPSSLEQIKSLADTNLIAARLYELLGWRFYLARINGQERVGFMYSELVKRIGLKREKYQSDAKDQLHKAHKYLKKRKIISGDPKWQESDKDWKIIYKPGESLISEINEWSRQKKIKDFTRQIEYTNPEIDCALEDIAEYLGKGEERTFTTIVAKIFKKHQKNGFEMVRRAISESKAEEPSGNIKNKPAYLTTILKKYAE